MLVPLVALRVSSNVHLQELVLHHDYLVCWYILISAVMLGPNPLATLAEALKALRPGALTEALKPPMFDWQMTEQYEDFCLFCKSMESWYCLQGMKEEPDNDTRLEYLLNFLGTTGQWKHEQWKHDGATKAIYKNKTKSAAEFLEYLSSMMDHPMSQ